ncbi:MAG: hypothetical protein CMJ85_14455 [Planctomycetes bacterium]|jgi:hypothetical protein|nr:hypothetical protein [Planctomycetota bacterium]
MEVAEEYVPFEEALKSLQMSESQLKHLVSQDEIQAIRDPGGSVRLRKEDVESLRQTGEIAEDLVFADDDGDDDAGMVTAVLEEDSLLEEEDTLDLAADELEIVDAQSPAAAPRRGSLAPVRSRGRAASMRGDEEEPHEGTLDRIAVVGSAALLVYALFFVYSITQGQKTGLTAWLADMFKM